MVKMAANPERRRAKRFTMEQSFNVRHKGKPCRVVDISLTGLGVTFIGQENWPENLTLEYSLELGAKRAGLVKCRTVWETSMDFYKGRDDEVVRRRGLEFLEPGSGGVKELYQHLKQMAAAN